MKTGTRFKIGITLMLLIIAELFGAAAKAQTTKTGYLTLTPNTNVQSFTALPLGSLNQVIYATGTGYDYVYVVGYDSAGEATTNQTVPSGYLVFTHQVSMAANKKLTDTFKLPTSPVNGQTVKIVANKAFYHLFKTTPAYITVDTAGIQEAVLQYFGSGWRMVHLYEGQLYEQPGSYPGDNRIACKWLLRL